MRIHSFQPAIISKPTSFCEGQQQSVIQSLSRGAHINYPCAHVPFYGQINVASREKLTDNDYEKALNYFNERTSDLNTSQTYHSLYNYNLDKLNGIQKGIEVFDGLSMKEIAFVCCGLYEVSVNRGCGNRCAHCYADAVPHIFDKDKEANMISKMSWEDYSSLMTGIGELNNRLGFNLIRENTNERTFALFRDSDCIEMEMKDKDGNIYDFIDANELQCNSINRTGLFDTAGWTPTNKKLQERAEKIVNYFANPDNVEKIDQINISINPFHGLNAKSIAYKQAGNEVAAKKMRDLYIDRMANTLFTFTPLLGHISFNCMNRMMDVPDETPNGYDRASLVKLNKEILEKLQIRYLEDFNSQKKYIKEYDDINKNIMRCSFKLRKQFSISNVGRAESLLNSEAAREKNQKFQDYKQMAFRHLLSSRYLLPMNTICTTIDANGKIYASSEHVVVPTEIQLNFNNKNKETKPFGNLEKEFKVTNSMINRSFLEYN